jgi:hypothetical protein
VLRAGLKIVFGARFDEPLAYEKYFRSFAAIGHGAHHRRAPQKFVHPIKTWVARAGSALLCRVMLSSERTPPVKKRPQDPRISMRIGADLVVPIECSNRAVRSGGGKADKYWSAILS